MPKGSFIMLKAEFIRELKKTNISKDSEKTKQRLRAAWQPLSKDQREETLALADMKKVSVERAYKTGGASAKVVIALAQVLNIDPKYFTGESDEQGVYEVDAVTKYLVDLGYDIGKGDVVRRRAAKKATSVDKATPADSQNTNAPEKSSVVADATADNANKLPKSFAEQLDALANNMTKQLSEDVRGMIDGITEENVNHLYKSLCIQSDYSGDKKNRAALIKCLLLM
jgi:hypothetical protein